MCLTLAYFFFFFFFKQKTEYDMRISDWSSDVCSSDLWQGCDPAGRCLNSSSRAAKPPGAQSERFDEVANALRRLDAFGQRRNQIGRASCRERVCQYV